MGFADRFLCNWRDVGGHRSGRKLKPEEIDGYAQSIRDSMMIGDAGKKLLPVVTVKAPPAVTKADMKEVRMAEPTGETDKKGKAQWKVTDATKLVWKPKARASGGGSVGSSPTKLDQGIAHKFGSERGVSSVEAAKRASERAQIMQSEVGGTENGTLAGKSDPKSELPIGDFLKNPTEGLLSYGQEIHVGRNGSNLWGKSVLPLDFNMADFSDLEEPTRKLYQLNDEWIYQDDVNPVLVSSPISLRPREEQVQQWRNAYHPEMADRIVPFVRNAMASNLDPLIGLDEAYIMALDHLAEGGARIDQVCAKTALEVFKTKMLGRVGKERLAPATFHPQMKCVDYMVQNVSAGALHFAAVDMGGDVTLSIRLQQALGSESPNELNQCIVKHLALALEWWNNGRKLNVPTRSRVDTIATELRA